MTLPTSPCGPRPSSSSARCAPTSRATSRASRASVGLAALLALASAGCPASSGSTTDGAREAPAPAEAPSEPAAPAETRAERRARAHAAARDGRLDEADPILLALWRTGEDPASLADGALLAALRARAGRADDALALLAEAEGRKLPMDHLLDLASAVANDAPDPGALAARLRASADAVRGPHRAALVAGLLQRAGRPRDAIVYFKVAERLSPDDPLFPRRLSSLYAVTGDMAGLEASLRRLLALDPSDYGARVNLVRRLVADGRTKEAVAAARPPEGLFPRARSETVAGDALERAGLVGPALEAYDAALEADPAACDALFGKRRAQLRSGAREAGRAGLWRLVEAPVAGRPCHVAESARLLLGRPPDRAMGRRLVALANGSGGADRTTLRELLEAAGLMKRADRPAPPDSTPAAAKEPAAASAGK